MAPHPAESPPVCLVIAYHEEGDNLLRSLDSVILEPGDSVVVVDDGPPPDFVEVCAVVGRVFAAAVLGRDDDARADLALLARMDLTRLPVVGSTWVVEHVGLARILVDVDEEPVPHDWFAGEPLGRPLLRSVSTTALDLMGALCRGGASPDLLGRLTDLWAVFETRKPSGIVTRHHVDALDFAVAGPMSTDLIGPPGADVVSSERRPMTVSVRAAVETGRLLRCAPDDLIGNGPRARRGRSPVSPGCWRGPWCCAEPAPCPHGCAVRSRTSRTTRGWNRRSSRCCGPGPPMRRRSTRRLATCCCAPGPRSPSRRGSPSATTPPTSNAPCARHA